MVVAVTSLICRSRTLLVIALLYPVVTLFRGVPMWRFARAALPAALIASSSSLTLAPLTALVEAAEDALALPKTVTGFMLPLGAAAVHDHPGLGFEGFASPGIPSDDFNMLMPLVQ